MFTVRYGEDSVEIGSDSPEEMSIAKAVILAFGAKRWNGGKPPARWRFSVTNSAEIAYTHLLKTDLVSNGDTIIVGGAEMSQLASSLSFERRFE